jgi:adenylosuccinate synthase
LSIDIVIGGQFGSEGKGSVVSWLARNTTYDMAIRTGAPNAGHTFIAPNGKVYKMRQLPCTWAFQPAHLHIPATGIIDLEVLEKEIGWLNDGGFQGKILVSPLATVISKEAKMQERFISTGTTGEGVGATRAMKCLRNASRFDNEVIKDHSILHEDASYAMHFIRNGSNNILIETTQGFGLSMDYQYYPFCTSTNLNTYSLLAEAGIPYGIHQVKVWLVLRTFPIRIAGNSGYLFNETSWDSLRRNFGSHIPYEFTTVTNKMRRVGEFDSSLAKDAIEMCQPNEIILTFFDYLYPEFGKHGFNSAVFHSLDHFEGQIGRKISYVGVGAGKIERVPYH